MTDPPAGARAGWILLILILPLFGILTYVIVRPTMTDDDRKRAMVAGRRPLAYSGPEHSRRLPRRPDQAADAAGVIQTSWCIPIA